MKHRSFTGAADARFVTQAAFSRRIRVNASNLHDNISTIELPPTEQHIGGIEVVPAGEA